MPEYLAPGVFVEEVSFRAKSIEGVSTSTTGFVGPTRRGPLARPDTSGRPPAALEVLTSFLDFQRIYGGFEDLTFDGDPADTVNYLAHAARAYFDNGGSRLFVARVYAGTGGTASAPVPGTGAQFVARFPGESGNGTLRIALRGEPTTTAALVRAPAGSIARTGTASQPALGGRITGGIGPFALPQDGQLWLTVGASPVAITFHGEAAELTGGTLAATVPALGANNILTVEIEGRSIAITLPTAATAREVLVDTINRNLPGGYARLGTGNELILGSDVFGLAADIRVRSSSAGAPLGFIGDPQRLGTSIPANNVDDRRAVTAADIDRLFANATPTPIAVTAATDTTGRLTLTATPGNSIAIRTSPPGPPGTTLIHGALGFGPTDAGAGAAGSTLVYYVRDSLGVWRDGGGTAMPVNADTLGIELATVTIVATDGDGLDKQYEGMGVHPDHPRYLGTVMSEAPSRRADQLEQLFAFAPGAPAPGALALAAALAANPTITLAGGTDGDRPTAADYATALEALAAIEDISIVAAPGSSADDAIRPAVHNALITHAEARRAYRIAVLDSRRISTISEARDDRAPLDSTRAALYAPWVVVPNPLYKTGDETRPRELALPPSGFVTGIYARTDVLRGVFKAPANEVVRGALRYDLDINFAQQETLNPIGVNCLRTFPNRGNRVWGARTISSDPEWKYVPIRRYFNYLERSIDVGTQWAVFEPNGERLWGNIRETISSFLVNEWRSGALLGSSPKEAFFVRCDRSTMDQNDLDNGRLVCLIGVAAVKPAEFVIFRIGQMTVDART